MFVHGCVERQQLYSGCVPVLQSGVCQQRGVRLERGRHAVCVFLHGCVDRR